MWLELVENGAHELPAAQVVAAVHLKVASFRIINFANLIITGWSNNKWNKNLI